MLMPRSPLSTGRYTATVTAGVMDLAGNPLAADHVWRFDVVARPFNQTYLPQIQIAPSGGVCNNVTDIPYSECEALLALQEGQTEHRLADGPRWPPY